MDATKLTGALDATRNAVCQIGKALLKSYGNIEPNHKELTGDFVRTIVTELDVQAEEFLFAELSKFDSSIGFHGEEFGVRTESDTTWLVDPIDGTSHFVRGLPFCTTMVALIEHHQVIMSVIYDFVQQDTYWAIRGAGAFKNDTPLTISSRPLGQSLLAYETNVSVGRNLASYLKLREKSKVMNTVNSGFEFAMVASGKLDGRIATDPYGYDWDYAPGSLLVEEAGGVVRNIGKSSYDYRNHNYIAANPVAYEQLTQGPDAIFPVE